WASPSASPAMMAQNWQPNGSGGIGHLPGLGRLLLRHQHLAPEVADLLAPLVEAPGLDGHHAPVGLALRLHLVEHRGHGVDRVAVERRHLVLQRLDLQVGDGRPADVGDAHAEHQRVHEVAHHDVLAELGGLLGVPGVGVEGVVVHGDHAEEVVVVLGDRLARPVPVDVADLEVLEVPAERPVVHGHRLATSTVEPARSLGASGGGVRKATTCGRTIGSMSTQGEGRRMKIEIRHPMRLVALSWAAVSLAGVTAAVATPPSGDTTRNELAVGKVTDDINIQRSSPSDFHIQQLTLAPGANSGWHSHPGPEYSVVKAGEVVLERSPACAPITVKAGQGFFTPGGMPHMAHNDSSAPAELYVTYTVPAG